MYRINYSIEKVLPVLLTTNFFRIFKYILTTTITNPVMAANDTTAFRALPFLFFPLQKRLDAFTSDNLQVLQHTHVVFGRIAFVQLFESLAGKISTLITKSRGVGFYRLAISNRAFPAIRAHIRVFAGTTKAFILFPEVRHANSAVHAAGRNQAFIQSP